MKITIQPIHLWRPRWNWFTLGVLLSATPFTSFIIGIGFISFEVHLMSYGEGWFDMSIHLNCPLGYAGIEIEFTTKEEE